MCSVSVKLLCHAFGGRGASRRAPTWLVGVSSFGWGNGVRIPAFAGMTERGRGIRGRGTEGGPPPSRGIRGRGAEGVAVGMRRTNALGGCCAVSVC